MTATIDPPPPSETDPKATATRWRPLRRLRRPALSGLTVFVALVAAVVALGFTLWPGLAPDPRVTFRAHVGVFAVDRGVTLRAYLHRISFSATAYRRNRLGYLHSVLGPSHDAASEAGLLRLPGEVAYVASTVEGFKRRSVLLRWSLYRARGGRRLTAPGFGGMTAARVGLEAPTDRTMQEIWLPPPPGRGPYFVRVALYDERDVLLDVADSRPFGGA